MITLGFIAVAMVIIALLFILPPLFRQSKIDSSVIDANDSREKRNIEIAKERIKSLKEERDEAIIDEAAFQRAREEIEQQLYNELNSEQPQPLAGTNSAKASQTVGKKTAWLLIGLIPLTVLLLYRTIGTPNMITPPPPPVATNAPAAEQSIEVIVAKLAKKMETMPDNIEGWMLLGRSYMRMQQYTKATNALARAYALKKNDPALIVQYVDALVMSQQGQFKGKPTELLQQALRLNPDEPLALWMGGMAAAEQGDFQTALRHWQRLKPQMVNDAEATQQLDQMIADIQPQLSGQPALPTPMVDRPVAPVETPPAPAPIDAAVATIKVEVTLSPELASAVDGETTLFILAQAVSGPPMPLAVARKQVKDLPLSVTLSDAMAMMPAMKLSAFKQVKITARISKSGQAMSRPGDLIGQQAPVTVGDPATVKIVIDGVVP